MEAKLGQGETVAAREQAQALLEAQPESAYTQELMGKVLLKEGRYAEAETFFVSAREGARTDNDRARLEDLIALSRYFAAYETGQPQQADHHLRDIKNAELQQAVDTSTEKVTVGDS